LKTALVEKCQSSKMWILKIESLKNCQLL
jgi:hypothetical protein